MHDPGHSHAHHQDAPLAASAFAVSAGQRLAAAGGAAAVLWLCVAWALGWL
jgi:hypothetical protein